MLIDLWAQYKYKLLMANWAIPHTKCKQVYDKRGPFIIHFYQPHLSPLSLLAGYAGVNTQ